MQDIILKITKLHGLDTNSVLKKPIRGLKGYNVYDLLEGLLVKGNLTDCAQYLGYTENPVKQSIKSVLMPLFPGRSKHYGTGGGLPPWRFTLLNSIGFKHCAKCDKIKQHNEFYRHKGNSDGLDSKCSACKIVESKYHKYYIVQRTPNWSDLDLIRDFYINCPTGYHVDHILPLRGDKVSGLHILSNLQYLPIKENMSKGNRIDLEEFNARVVERYTQET